jgi:hypothetical protein
MTAHVTIQRNGARHTVLVTTTALALTPICPTISPIWRAGQRNLGDAECRGDTHAHTNCATATADSLKLVENPDSRRSVRIPGHQRSNR